MQTEMASHRELAATPVVAPHPVQDTGRSHMPAHTVAPPEPEVKKELPAPARQANASDSWFARNRWFTREPISYLGYQAFRSTMATIPYGFGMATVHHLMGLLSVKGQRMGLTEAGIQAFNKEGIGALNGAINSVIHNPEFHKPGLRAGIGRNMMRLANSPLNPALQIGVSFTMFRFVGSIVKNLRDKVMDEKNTPDDTNREVKNAKQTIKETAKVNWKAEYTGTLWAALTLGFIGALFKPSEPYARKILADGSTEKTFDAFKRVWGKSSKLLQNCAIWAISYSAFFEVDERIQKDVKLRDGNWKGHSNSLLNKPDATVGTPPDKDDKADKPKYAAFTEDPSVGRVVFRRLLPVAVGISAYAVLKRAGYVLFGGTMKPVTDEVVRKGVGGNIKHWATNVWREGGATSMFFALWMATDTWGVMYDKFFNRLQGKGHADVAPAQAALPAPEGKAEGHHCGAQCGCHKPEAAAKEHPHAHASPEAKIHHAHHDARVHGAHTEQAV